MTRILPLKFSPLSRRLEVMGARRNGAREARGQVREAHDSRFNLLCGSADISDWSRAPEGKSSRVGQENCQSKKTRDRFHTCSTWADKAMRVFY